MYWDETLDLELENIQDICSKSDIDFEFVLDQSGSISTADWTLTLDIIAEVYFFRPKINKLKIFSNGFQLQYDQEDQKFVEIM